MKEVLRFFFCWPGYLSCRVCTDIICAFCRFLRTITHEKCKTEKLKFDSSQGMSHCP